MTSLGQTDIAADALIAVDAMSLSCKANLLRVVERSVTTIVRVQSCVQFFGRSWHPCASYLARLGKRVDVHASDRVSGPTSDPVTDAIRSSNSLIRVARVD